MKHRRLENMRYSFVLLLVIFFFASIRAPAEEPPRAPEVRAIWVTRWDYRSAADIRTILGNCRSLGLNRVYFQVRGRSDAFYRSNLEPWAEELGGRDPGFDPLAVAIAEARKQALELHAWANVLAGWKGRSPPKNTTHLYHAHPKWFLTDRSGKTWRLSHHYTMLNPCNSAVRRHLAEVFGDLASRYEIDGVHLDYIRFVFPDADKRDQVPYDNGTLHIFRKETTGFPSRYPDRWNDFRRRGINTVVYDISRQVRKVRPGCKISAAVIRDLRRGRETFFQDSPTWLRYGWIDEVIPMNYETDLSRFESLARKDIGQAGRDRLIPGLGVHVMDGEADLRKQIEITRALHSPGYSLFAYTSFFPTPSHASSQGKRADLERRAFRRELIRLNRR